MVNTTILTQKLKWEEKQLYEHNKQQISKVLHEKTSTCLKKGNLKRETKSLLIIAQKAQKDPLC